jgi:hypothetical protein
MFTLLTNNKKRGAGKYYAASAWFFPVQYIIPSDVVFQLLNRMVQMSFFLHDLAFNFAQMHFANRGRM